MTSPTPYAQANGTTLQPNADEPQQSGKQKSSSDGDASTRKGTQQTAAPPSSLASVSAHIHAKLTSFLSEQHDPSSLLHRVQDQTRISLSVIQDALSRYSLEELSLSYNGGKDCLVLLLLFLACLHTDHHLPSSNPSPASSNNTDHTNHTRSTNTNDNDNNDMIPAIYVRPAHPFPSVESFVATSSQHYHLQLTTNPPHTSLRTAFSDYLSAHPRIRAIFVGTRRTDPHGATLTHFDATDHGWPDFMRIHPVIDWHYAEIWAFIRHLEVEYCPLYDEGYTSLGGTNDTHPNPKLRRKRVESTTETNKNEESHSYRPAYELMDDDEERLGRDWS